VVCAKAGPARVTPDSNVVASRAVLESRMFLPFG
jgi:hypothetical protein